MGPCLRRGFRLDDDFFAGVGARAARTARAEKGPAARVPRPAVRIRLRLQGDRAEHHRQGAKLGQHTDLLVVRELGIARIVQTTELVANLNTQVNSKTGVSKLVHLAALQAAPRSLVVQSATQYHRALRRPLKLEGELRCRVLHQGPALGEVLHRGNFFSIHADNHVTLLDALVCAPRPLHDHDNLLTTDRQPSGHMTRTNRGEISHLSASLCVVVLLVVRVRVPVAGVPRR
mmetsp:Transcript_16836/g.41694  ORF Transcript_16836/g.41694 Transcript_16836/m.41694 type:complete len:232 (-) Transcript_16836:152-847(-)